uniref:Uncharacterized protein n=1 Tax=viral metagenome TaxID=1070528 RepID=A0A6C0BJ16_9ZZZZ
MEKKSWINPCIYSSFFFLTNVCTTAYFGHFIYSLGFYILFLTSILFHSSYSALTRALDKIPITFVVLYGGYLFYTKLQDEQNSLVSCAIVLTFVATGYIFLYQIPVTENKPLQYKLHSLLHAISSMGHHLIVLL